MIKVKNRKILLLPGDGIGPEVVNEVKKIDVRNEIESLEDKVSSNLDEMLYSELLSLRNQLKSG